MADATVAKLQERFAPGNEQLEADVVAQLTSIMRMHGLSVQQLFFKWEAYCIKMGIEASQLTMEWLRSFKQDLQDVLERRNQQGPQLGHQASLGLHPKKTAATPRNAAKYGDAFGLLDGLVPSTPAGGKSSGGRLQTPSMSRTKATGVASSPDFKTPKSVGDQLNELGAIPSTDFKERGNAGEVIEILNPQLAAATAPPAPFAEPRIKLTAASDQKKLAYKPMGMKLSEASEILDDRIDEFTSLVMDHHHLEAEAFGSAASQSTAEVVAVGRIASDAAEGKLNAASVVLETSRRMGGGLRVPLDLGRLPGYQLFPGQIVALRGTNATGSVFVVNAALELPLLPNAASPRGVLEATRAKMRADSRDKDAMDLDGATQPPPRPLQMLFASGPYTADDNLDFEPLHALCSQAADALVDLVVLAGPFLDADHPLLAAGDFDLPEDTAASTAAAADADTATMATVFRHLVTPALQRLVAAHPTVTVLLVPSVRDVIDKHVSWPQDAFSRRELGLPKAVRIVGNPMAVSVNEAVLGVSTQDVLYELRHEELAGGRVAEPNAVTRACRHLLEQRHYFPLFPALDRRRLPRTGVADNGGLATGAMLDVGYLKLGEMVNVRPDVLLVPSALPPFAKVVESVVVINPGYLSKRRGPGTYARMTLHAPEVEEGDWDEMLGHQVFDRARVEITRI